jgi:hypothetical protein
VSGIQKIVIKEYSLSESYVPCRDCTIEYNRMTNELYSVYNEGVFQDEPFKSLSEILRLMADAMEEYPYEIEISDDGIELSVHDY